MAHLRREKGGFARLLRKCRLAIRQLLSHIGAMNLELSDEETAALTHKSFADAVRERPIPIKPAHPHAEGCPPQVEAGAGARAIATTEALRAAASYRGQKAALIEIRAGFARYARKLGRGRRPPNGMVQGMPASG